MLLLWNHFAELIENSFSKTWNKVVELSPIIWKAIEFVINSIAKMIRK